MNYLWSIILAINIVAFILVAIDKWKSKHNKWRIRESSFFIIGLLGGGIGVYAGMIIFRHKTNHLKFTMGIPVLILINMASVYLLVTKVIINK